MRTLEQLKDDVKYYQEIRDRASREGNYRTAEGAQWNIDNCKDKIYDMKMKGK